MRWVTDCMRASLLQMMLANHLRSTTSILMSSPVNAAYLATTASVSSLRFCFSNLLSLSFLSESASHSFSILISSSLVFSFFAFLMAFFTSAAFTERVLSSFSASSSLSLKLKTSWFCSTSSSISDCLPSTWTRMSLISFVSVVKYSANRMLTGRRSQTISSYIQADSLTVVFLVFLSVVSLRFTAFTSG